MIPIISILPGKQKRLRGGHPWAYSNEIDMTAETRALEAGSVVSVKGNDGTSFGTAHFNPHSLVGARMLSRQMDAAPDAAFFKERLSHALALRDRFFSTPHYRLIHAEADGLPGLIVDRYGDIVVLQFNTAGMERARNDILAAIDTVLKPKLCVLRNDSPAREREGLSLGVEFVGGDTGGETGGGAEGEQVLAEVEENGVRYAVDLREGQKTGWFFDQRENRRFVASLAKGQRVIDFYSHSGGFGVQAAAKGAASVTMVDRSSLALDLAMQSAQLNGAEARCETIKGDCFSELGRLGKSEERYDVVIADPPAFVKSKKDLNAGGRGYRKLARLASALVAPGGILFLASCSHNMAADLFLRHVADGLRDAHRTGRVLRAAGADLDHPIHPNLPESAYLKTLTLQID